MEFSPSQVDALCKCISPVATGPKCKRRRKRSDIEERADANAGRSASSCSAEVSVQFTEPWRFCTFYTSYPRTTSPFKKYTASALTSLCKCAIAKPSSTTSKKASTTTKKHKANHHIQKDFDNEHKENDYFDQASDSAEASNNQQQKANNDQHQETHNYKHQEANKHKHQKGHLDKHEEIDCHKHYQETINDQCAKVNIKHKASQLNQFEEIEMLAG
ncbi:hypothetical protein QM012_005046 [Aureobasidium pullulans]|uniref:Uncharacterized protein n=1 Tax=Aureobasidium pullulans TaxID=5580 RepID=A0ABR0T6A1_AURPU